MSWQRWILAVVIVIVGTAQYGLMVHAVRDLIRRPTVRGGNKAAWALVILIVPIAGALVYASLGPTSFLPRPDRPPRRPPATDPDAA